jgi:transposase
MSQVHVITGAERRRRWTEEQKRALVAEAFAPGAVVTDIARQADISSTLLYRWRRQFAGESGSFAQALLTGPGPELRNGASSDAIEIDFGNGSRVRLPTSTRPELALAVVKALVRR